MNPFEEFFPRKFCQDENQLVSFDHTCGKDYFVVDRVFKPDITIHREENRIRTEASYDEFHYTLCSANDLLRWMGDITDNFIYYIQGIIGERLLTVVLEAFIDQMRTSSPGVTRSGVIREKVRHREKGYVVTYNDSYILKHDKRTNFVILSKPTDDTPRSEYKQEKYGLRNTEIDGIAYIYFNGDKNLVISEVSTRDNKGQLSVNAWLKGTIKGLEEKVKQNVSKTLFEPLTSLFPRHNFLYFIMAPENTLWYQYRGRLRLRKRTGILYQAIRSAGVDVMFVPIPRLEPTIPEIAGILYRSLPLSREILEAIRKRRSY